MAILQQNLSHHDTLAARELVQPSANGRKQTCGRGVPIFSCPTRRPVQNLEERVGPLLSEFQPACQGLVELPQVLAGASQGKVEFAARDESHADAAQEVDNRRIGHIPKWDKRPDMSGLIPEGFVAEQPVDGLRAAYLCLGERLGLHAGQVASQARASGRVVALPPQGLPTRLAGIHQKLQVKGTGRDEPEVPYRPMERLLRKAFGADATLGAATSVEQASRQGHAAEHAETAVGRTEGYRLQVRHRYSCVGRQGFEPRTLGLVRELPEPTPGHGRPCIPKVPEFRQAEHVADEAFVRVGVGGDAVRGRRSGYQSLHGWGHRTLPPSTAFYGQTGAACQRGTGSRPPCLRPGHEKEPATSPRSPPARAQGFRAGHGPPSSREPRRQ